MGYNEAVRVVAPMAQTQQILVQAQRQIQFATVHVIARLPIGNPKKLRGRTQLLPKLACTGIYMAGFGSGPAPNGESDCAEIGLQNEFFVPSLARVGQKRGAGPRLFELAPG